MNLHGGHNKVVSLQQALEVQKTLAKHNPFVRMKDGTDRSRRLTPDEQKLANQTDAILKKATYTQELHELMESEKYKALFLKE